MKAEAQGFPLHSSWIKPTQKDMFQVKGQERGLHITAWAKCLFPTISHMVNEHAKDCLTAINITSRDQKLDIFSYCSSAWIAFLIVCANLFDISIQVWGKFCRKCKLSRMWTSKHKSLSRQGTIFMKQRLYVGTIPNSSPFQFR